MIYDNASLGENGVGPCQKHNGQCVSLFAFVFAVLTLDLDTDPECE